MKTTIFQDTTGKVLETYKMATQFTPISIGEKVLLKCGRYTVIDVLHTPMIQLRTITIGIVPIKLELSGTPAVTDENNDFNN